MARTKKQSTEAAVREIRDVATAHAPQARSEDLIHSHHEDGGHELRKMLTEAVRSPRVVYPNDRELRRLSNGWYRFLGLADGMAMAWRGPKARLSSICANLHWLDGWDAPARGPCDVC